MRTSKLGTFDAAISMLNSVGCLGREDFGRALSNINENLEMGGLFVFDNTNLGCLEAGGLVPTTMIDTAGEAG